MGLDMYLSLRKYESLGKWEQKNVEVDGFYPAELKELANDIFEHNFMSKETTYQVGYWRKANAIHKYFIDKFADGEDNCQDIYPTIEGLEELLSICEKVKENHDKANELLPTTSGFFFGGTEYGTYYFERIDYTIKLLKKVIDFLHKNKDYYPVYCASW